METPEPSSATSQSDTHGFSQEFLDSLRCQAMTKSGTQCTLYVPCRWHQQRQPYRPGAGLPDFRTLAGRHRFRERLARALLSDQLAPPVVAVAIKILDSAREDEEAQHRMALASGRGGRPVTIEVPDYRMLTEP